MGNSTKPPAAAPQQQQQQQQQHHHHHHKEGGDRKAVRFGVPASKHHLIIGRGGTVIKDLTSQFNVNIEVSKKDSPNDTVTIEGTKHDVERARLALEKLLGIEIKNTPVYTFELAVPSHKYGAVIGPKGETIRELERTSRAVIEIPPKHAQGKPILVIGSQDACRSGQAAIERVIGQAVAVKIKNDKYWFDKDVPLETVDLSKKVSRVLFFPDEKGPDGSTGMQSLLKYLNSCKKTLDICIFCFTNDDLAATVLLAHRRGVTVRIIVDNEQAYAQGSDILKFCKAGIPVRMDGRGGHMHHKFAILDGSVVLNGSFNWTVQAQLSNNENVMLTSDPSFITPFKNQFDLLWTSFKGNHYKS